MDAFYTGLWTFWAAQSASTFYTGIGGRLRSNIARQNEVKPYAVITQIDGLPEYFQDGDYDAVHYIELQLDIYSESNTEVLALSKKCTDLFDTATFSVTGWSLLDFEKFRELLMPVEDGEDLDHPLHRYLLHYRATLQRNRV